MKIDVILPVYNAVETLRSAVESVLEQSHSDFILYLLNDGSTDGSTELCDELEQEDSRVRHVHQVSNKGIVETLNHGITLGGAEYIARMDADDIAYHDRFARQIELFEKEPDVVACSGSYKCMDIEGNVFTKHVARNTAMKLSAVPAMPHFLLHPFLMVKRKVLLEVNGYRHIRHVEDVDLYFRLSEHGKLFNLERVLGLYRIHRESVSVRSHSNLILQCANSQILCLYVSSGEHYPVERALLLEQAFSDTSLSLEDAILSSININNLSAKDESWLVMAIVSKLLQEVAFRGVEIRTDDKLYICSLALAKWCYPSKQNQSFMRHFTRWYGDERKRSKMNKNDFTLKVIYCLYSFKQKLVSVIKRFI